MSNNKADQKNSNNTTLNNNNGRYKAKHDNRSKQKNPNYKK